uniref:ATP synthase F0 subunit 8 n=1 Tax=Palpitomonas bilix TaxID=652834 RepID=A0A1E1GHQ5_9EUKA|nr:ATP synthase F0 subunit 8 [Palpitomonas bilix]BAV82400.1 ATP synthase F0 subunit 8 [Palpitomonas bilix]
MPQLDQVTFNLQVIWMAFYFIVFYFLTAYFLVPQISKSLKFRKKNLNISSNTNNNNLLENDSLTVSYDNVFKKALNSSSTSINETLKSTQEWQNNVLKDLNNKNLFNANTNYIKFIHQKEYKKYIISELLK